MLKRSLRLSTTSWADFDRVAEHDVVPTRSTTGQHDYQSIEVPQANQQGLECSGQTLLLRIESSAPLDRHLCFLQHVGPHGKVQCVRWKHRTLRQEDRLGRLRGLGKYESRHQASANLFVNPEGHGVIVLDSQFPEKAQRESGAKAPSCIHRGAPCPYSGSSNL